MLITEDQSNALYQIRAFTDHSITVNNTIYNQSLIISPTQLLANWGPQSSDAIMEQHLLELIDMPADILLIGTGKSFHHLNASLTDLMANAKIGIEIMNTPAACRTYMALLAEGRRVIAALIIDENKS